ncbi:DUF2958 domain-containing protein [Methylobacterium sp. 190mf]|uniref:DUF2958 domain-containing protein n=1 Tax=Methylobacterium sp. 190mf TaxID=1761798 RepID=UPI0011B07E6A|nr:DUF2958 domain-containing protein [Methylobacterium sp. 190mf]
MHQMKPAHRASWPRTASTASEGCQRVKQTEVDRSRSDCGAIHPASASTSGWDESPSISEPELGFVSLAEVAALQGRLRLVVARSAAFVAYKFRGAESGLNEGSHPPPPRQPWLAAVQPFSARSSG